jgi:hypothetical protein
VSFSVVIPSKTTSNLTACVRAIRAAGETCRIVVVDDGLDPLPPDVAATVTVIPGIKPFIFSRAINAGVRAAIEANPDVQGFCFVNDDCLLQTPKGFTLLHEASQAHPEIGCIGAVTNLTGQPLQQPRGIGLRAAPHIAYVCVYVPRATLENVQWMDERYCLDYGVDDRDHCEAIARAGLKVAVHDGCYVDHGSLVSSFRGDPTTPRSFKQNYGLLIEKWGGVLATGA